MQSTDETLDPVSGLVGTPTAQLNDDLVIPEKKSSWTDAEREREAEVAAEVAAAPDATDIERDVPVKAPAWLKRVAPGTTVKHQGVVLNVVHIGFAQGRFMVLMEPLGLEANTAGQRRARYDELIRQGLGKKAAKRKVREEFARQGDEAELEEAGEVADGLR